MRNFLVEDVRARLWPARDVTEQSKQKQSHEEEEENLGDTGSGNGDSSEAENGRQQSHDEKDKRPAQHVHSSLLSVNQNDACKSRGTSGTKSKSTGQKFCRGAHRSAIQRKTYLAARGLCRKTR